MFWVDRQHTQSMDTQTKFIILERKMVKGELFVYLKLDTGFYGWYRLEAVEAPVDTDTKEGGR